jgi:predicted nucleic acid-binding protein
MLLDTSGLMCYLDADSAGHPAARRLYAAATTPLTHNYVVAELIALWTARRRPRPMVLDFAAWLTEQSGVTFVWVSPPLHRAALDLLSRRPDKTYSLCDAVSFIVMDEYRLDEALTTDGHFRQAGFQALLEEYA